MLRILSLDLETFSTIDIKAGVYKYSEEAEILLLSYSYDYGPVKCIDLACGEKIPKQLEDDLFDPDVEKHAWNANFERVILAKHFGRYCEPEQWRCSMALAAQASLPLSLDGASKALGLSVEKDTKGKALIKYFSVPCKPTKVNGGRTRNLPEHDPEKWSQYRAYNKQDVIVEQSVEKNLKWMVVPEKEWEVWALDQRINDRGWGIDVAFVEKAISSAKEKDKEHSKEAEAITGLDNVNSVDQLKTWFKEEKDLTIDSLSKGTVSDMLEEVKDEDAKRVLELRAEMSKSSIKKYAAMRKAVGSDGRLRGMFQYGGASRTLRWSGRLAQPQNYPRITVPLDDLDEIRNMVMGDEVEVIECLYGSLPDMLSQLTRTAFIAKGNKTFRVLDYRQIEARILPWLAEEQWALDVFKGNGDLYKATAARMYKKKIEDVTKEERYNGKIATLALGYQGGVGALARMGADKYMSNDEMASIVSSWREANPNIVKLWKRLNNAAIRCVDRIEPVKVSLFEFSIKKDYLRLKLPSGRFLHYMKPELAEDQYGQVVSYLGLNQYTRKWERLETYGGRWSENVCQAIARDCLAQAMINLRDAPVVGHVHDEIIIEAEPGEWPVEKVREIMLKMPSWANGLPLDAEGAECKYYCK